MNSKVTRVIMTTRNYKIIPSQIDHKTLDLVGTSTEDTLINKTIDCSHNTISNISDLNLKEGKYPSVTSIGIQTEDLDMGLNIIKNVGLAKNEHDAISKFYLDKTISDTEEKLKKFFIDYLNSKRNFLGLVQL